MICYVLLAAANSMAGFPWISVVLASLLDIGYLISLAYSLPALVVVSNCLAASTVLEFTQ